MRNKAVLMSKKLNIISSGTGPETYIYDPEGKEITNVVRAVITLEANNVNTVELTIRGPAVSVAVVPGVVELTCPLCDFSHKHDCEGERKRNYIMGGKIL